MLEAKLNVILSQWRIFFFNQFYLKKTKNTIIEDLETGCDVNQSPLSKHFFNFKEPDILVCIHIVHKKVF